MDNNEWEYDETYVLAVVLLRQVVALGAHLAVLEGALEVVLKKRHDLHEILAGARQRISESIGEDLKLMGWQPDVADALCQRLLEGFEATDDRQN